MSLAKRVAPAGHVWANRRAPVAAAPCGKEEDREAGAMGELCGSLSGSGLEAGPCSHASQDDAFGPETAGAGEEAGANRRQAEIPLWC